MTDTSPLLVSRAQGWATLAMNQPERRNAMTAAMMDALADALQALSADASVAAIVLRGEGGAFSSGVDLTELQQSAGDGPAAARRFQTSLRRAHMALYHCACPIVVALERYGINGSTALALAGDVLVAGEGAFLQIGEIQQGVGIPMNAAWMRLRHGEAVLARMAFLGDRVPAPELHRLGVVQELVADDQVRARAEAIAQRIASFPAGASRAIKIDVRRQQRIDPETWFANQRDSTLHAAAQVRG
ncbi:MAG: enoyl-CoA hydratase/isomerase family protein [Burkholderiales bacterium]|nr:enoyl-CoA hydratase/isomerase family protein [Burkholderiales bacterium]